MVKSRKTGYGWNDEIDMGPVITSDSKKRIEELIQIAINEGGKAILDGRNTKIKGFESGNFINPTIIEDVNLKKEIINSLIKKTGLENERTKKIEQLSKGFKQRVGIAASLINDPKILFLDEPTASLDPDNADWIRTYLEQYQNTTGSTFIIASHNMLEVERMCNNVIMMGRGKVIDYGTPKELVDRYETRTLEQVFLQLARNDKV